MMENDHLHQHTHVEGTTHAHAHDHHDHDGEALPEHRPADRSVRTPAHDRASEHTHETYTAIIERLQASAALISQIEATLCIPRAR